MHSPIRIPVARVSSSFQLALRNDRQVRCDLLHFGKQMAGEEHGHASALGQVSNQGSYFMNTGGVESIGRLIEQQ